MKILHFILGKANPDRANGVNQVIYGLAKYQTLHGNQVYVLGISGSMACKSEIVDRDFFEVEVYKSFKRGGFDRFKELSKDVDIVHFHGVWNFMNIQASKFLVSINKPYVVTAHCGYSVDRLKQSNYWFKLLYHKLWQKKMFESSAGIHAITKEESTDILDYCDHSNVFVVPNGIDLSTYKSAKYEIKTREKVKFGYLGRLSVEKNIDNLILAFTLLPNALLNKVELHLIGPIENKSVKKFKSLVEKNKLDKVIFFDGGKYGKEKVCALLDLDAYIHPSYSDVVGISVMESLALGIPSIITRTSHVSYFYKRNAFVMVEPTAHNMSKSIIDFIEHVGDWHELSLGGRQLVVECFNWECVAKTMIKEYQSIIDTIII